jgi:hypothetical protein
MRERLEGVAGKARLKSNIFKETRRKRSPCFSFLVNMYYLYISMEFKVVFPPMYIVCTNEIQPPFINFCPSQPLVITNLHSGQLF